MNHLLSNEHVYPKSVLKQHISAEVELGIASAADPANANLPDLAPRTTTVSSPWFARTCRVCRDKFREGDLVRLCPNCDEPYHDDNQYRLYCWQKKFAGGAICNEGGPVRFSEESRDTQRCEFSWSQSLPADVKSSIPSLEATSPRASPSLLLVKQFVSGVETSWRPFGEQQNFRVMPHSPLVGRKCPWCRFRVRVGDWVVACPCQSNCGTYFHQDVFRHLTCWNEWNGIEGNNYCPNTGTPYPESLEGTEHDF